MVTNDDDDIDYDEDDDDDDDDSEDNENDRVGPQHVRLKVHGGFATLLNDLLQPTVHVLFPVPVLKARAVAEMRVWMHVESIGAYPTEAEHAEVVELQGPDAIAPELLDVLLVILATELLVGLFNIVEADLHAHRRFCNTPFVTSALSGWRQSVGHRGFSWFGGQIDAPSSEANPTVPPLALDAKWQRDECLLHVLALAVAPTLLLYSRCPTGCCRLHF